MFRIVLVNILFCLVLHFEGYGQAASLPGTAYTYHPPAKDKLAWQRLNLQLSSTFIVVAKEGQVEHDTCLYIASRSLGLSRLPVLAEGIDYKGLTGQTQWVDLQQPGIGVKLLSRTTGKQYVQILLLLASYYAFQPNSYYRYRDSVEYFVTKAIKESKTLKEDKLGRQALCLLGKIYVQANDIKGDSIFNTLIRQCREDGDKETEARAVAYRAIYAAPSPASFSQKVAGLQAASTLYHKLGNTEGEINVLVDLDYLFVVSGQFQLAQEASLKALALANAIRYPYTHYITDALSVATAFQGKFGEPLQYSFQTIKTSESCRDSIGWGHFYSRLSSMYSSEGRQKESQEMAQKSLQRFVSASDPSVYGILNTIIDNMGDEGHAQEALKLTVGIAKRVGIPNTFSELFSYHDAFAGCYLFLGKLDSAEIHARKMDSLETKAEMIRGPFRRGLVDDLYGHIFFKRGQYQKARHYFERQFTITSYGMRTLENDLRTYRSLINVDSALGDITSSVLHYKKYTQLLDSNFRVTQIRQAEELGVLYETQEKENQIAVLNQQASMEKANAKQAKQVKNLMLAGIIAVLVIAALLYRQNRLKQKNNTIVSLKNEQLQGLLTDKEWLLKEIHHRVKNNLQIVMSLLHSQSVYINNAAALMAIEDSRRRVYAMSLIHQKLYQSDSLAAIDMPAYITELVTHIKDSFDITSQLIFKQQVASLQLDVSQAIPLGLIINECLVNTIKYAFPSGNKGVVTISLQHGEENNLILVIADDGIGLPSGLDAMEHSSLGLELIRGLAKQLNGTLAIVSDNGLRVTIVFPVMNKQMVNETYINA